MTPSLTDQDRQQLRDRGLSEAELARQLDLFERLPYRHHLLRPCLLEDGVIALSPEEQEAHQKICDEAAATQRMVKFVPASGAASRMFKDLRTCYDGLCSGEKTTLSETTETFLRRLREFAFGADVTSPDPGEQPAEDLVRCREVLREALEADGLDLANLPKGLIKFHRVEGTPRTAFESHLVESALALADAEGRCRLHFTVSPEHQSRFEGLLSARRPDIEGRHGVSLDVAFSTQSPATDTIALDDQKRPFRQEDGTLLLRPGGHGALLGNLESADADLVFIKNIDNVAPENLVAESLNWMRTLLGMAAGLQRSIHQHQQALDENSADLGEVAAFYRESLHYKLPENWETWSAEKRQALLQLRLHRPLRITGMVRDEGATGGKPFWVRDADGFESCQIVEGAEVDLEDPAQKEAWGKGTHFNPVLLACGMRDFRGEAYKLAEHVNDDAWFLAKKTHQGRQLLALERPGLWNGSMAGWNTLFVEVPLLTFNPVKKVTDLLSPVHLGQSADRSQPG